MLLGTFINALLRPTEVYKIQGRDMISLDVIFGVATQVSEHLGQVLFIAKMRLGENYQVQWMPHKGI